MDPARPLRDVFTDLTGDPAARAGHDPAAVLAANGHPDLPDTLVAEAIVSYADTAPYEVAEHLAPYVMANSAVPAADPTAPDTDPATWLDQLATAPEAVELGPDSSLDDDTLADLTGGHESTPGAVAAVDAGFGFGGDAGTGYRAPDASDDPTFADIASSGPGADDLLPESEYWVTPAAPLRGDTEAEADEGDADETGGLADG
jgi:hypothetical protein